MASCRDFTTAKRDSNVHVDGVILCAVILVELPAPLLLADVGTQLLLAITVTAIAIEVQIPLLQNSSAENYDSGM